jgi:peptidoglycan/LPS O-acetylase OafA/YrhL
MFGTIHSWFHSFRWSGLECTGRKGGRMGLLRLILASSVVLGHASAGVIFTGPERAVQTFYIISGFYIAMVLDKTEAYKSVAVFYTNRFLRLWPSYIVIALTTLAGKLLVERSFASEFASLPVSAMLVLSFANLTLFLQDWVMFLAVPRGHLQFTSNFGTAHPRLDHFLLVPQAWSLGVELSFYLSAPFLLKKKNLTLGIVAGLALTGRLIIYSKGLNHDPWTYRFFPFEITLFLIGSLSYRLFRAISSRQWFRSRGIQVGATVLTLGATCIVSKVPGYWVYVAYYGLVALLLPAVFWLTKDTKLDRVIGELSYPVYINHILLINIYNVAAVRLRFLPQNHLHAGLIVLAVSIALAVMMNAVVQGPVERLRRIRARAGQARIVLVNQ